MPAEAPADARGVLKVRVPPSPTLSPTRRSFVGEETPSARHTRLRLTNLSPEIEKTRFLVTPTQFDASFEGGNLGSAKQITENEYELTIRPDTNAARYRVWFHFRVSNARPGQKVLFHVTNFSKSRSLYEDGMSPVFRSGPSGDRAWERVHPKDVFYYRAWDSNAPAPGLRGRGSSSSIERSSSVGSAGNDDESEKGILGDGGESASERRRPRKPHILSFTHVFEKDARVSCADDDASDGDGSRLNVSDEDGFVEFAYSYPFSFSEQRSALDALEARRLPHVRRRTLARSLEGRECDVLVIDGGNDPDALPGTASSPRRVAFLTGRVHPGETPASHALSGFLDFVVSAAPDAAALRREVTFVVVPMLNPDGCAAGNYRADSLGADLNRRWADCSATREPTLHAAKALIERYARDPTHALDFFVDVHAHTSSRASFVYVEPPRFGSDGETSDGEDDADDEVPLGGTLWREREKAFAWERAAALPRALERNAGAALGFALNRCRFCANPAKTGAGRRAVSAALVSEARAAAARERETRAKMASAEARFAPASLGLRSGAGAGMCYTLEMSFYGVCPESGGSVPRWSPWGSNDETYRRFGVGLAYAFLDYYGLRRDAEAEAVTARVFDAAAAGARARPERAFGNGAAERADRFAACAAPCLGEPEGRNAEGSAAAARDAPPWLRGASLASLASLSLGSGGSTPRRGFATGEEATAGAADETEPRAADASAFRAPATPFGVRGADAMAGDAPERRRDAAPSAGVHFRHTSESRNAPGGAKRLNAAYAKRATLLGSFRVPGPGAFAKGSQAHAAVKDGGVAFGVEADFARADSSER